MGVVGSTVRRLKRGRTKKENVCDHPSSIYQAKEDVLELISNLGMGKERRRGSACSGKVGLFPVRIELL